MSNDEWRWADPNGQQRSVRLDELRAALAGGQIAPSTLVWRAGWRDWRPAHEVPELTSASLSGAHGVVLNIPPPPLAVVAVQHEYEAAASALAPVPAQPVAEEPPPPPPYVPAAYPSSPSQEPLRTQIGGSAYAPVAPGSQPRMAPTLPTTIGLPPPPEVVAAAATSAPTPIDGSPALDLHAFVQAPVVHADRPDEVAADVDESAFLPKRLGPRLILDDLAALQDGRAPKNKLLLGALALVAIAVPVVVGAVIVKLVRKEPAVSAATASASASQAPPPTAPAATPAPADDRAADDRAAIPPPPVASTPMFGDCAKAGDVRTIAPRARAWSGIEALARGDAIALGFAAAPRDAVATTLDPTTLAPRATTRAKTKGGDAARVTPRLVDGKLTAAPDVDRRGDPVASRRVVATSAPIDVGRADGAIVWAPHRAASFTKLFPVASDAPLDALRATVLADRDGIALTFRQGGAVYVGVAQGDGELTPIGGLVAIDGVGQVGSPAIAASGDQVIVAWADRSAAADPWAIRWATMTIGQATAAPRAFALPDGGLGGHAMSPSLAPLGGGRFLLAWTEGPVSRHQVRAVTIGADGAASGAPIDVSAEGVNAGQPAAVVGPDGRGAIAFLVAKGKVLELHAIPIRCAAP